MEHSTFGSRLFESVRRSSIHRGRKRWFGGVASGYAAQMNISPLLVRAGFVALTLFGGLGLIIYGISWALLPEPGDERIHLQEALSGRFDGALALAGAVTLLGVLTAGLFMPVVGLAITGAVRFAAVIGVIGAIAGAAVLLFHTLRHRPTGPTAPANTPAPSSDADGGPRVGSDSDSENVPGDATVNASNDVVDTHETPPASATAANAATTAPAADAPQVSETAPLNPSAPPVYSRAPAAPRRRSPGPGRRAIALSFAVMLLAPAGVLAAWHWGGFHHPFPPVALFAVVAVGLGLIITILGLMGRRAGVINMFAIAAIFVGGITGGATFDPTAASALNWDAPRESALHFDVRVSTVEQLENIDWGLTAPAHYVTLTLDIPAADAPARASIAPPPGTQLQIQYRDDLPLELRVSGADAEVFGDFNSGVVETARALGGRYEGFFSIASGGSLRYLAQPSKSNFVLDVDAPGSTINLTQWSDS